jgi:transcriptional regulator with XRE-family HTH domain
LSQRALADQAGVAPSTIARIEAHAQQPSLPLLAKLLAAADFELRTRIEDYDSHDDILDAQRARRSEAQQ